MKRHTAIARRGLPSRLAGLALVGAAAVCAQTRPPVPATPAAVAGEEAVVLSPFQVAADSEKGYLATQTLNGTRIATSLKDIGSALTVFTDQMLDDLGANSIYDLMAFAPNTDPFVMATSDITGNGNDFINEPTKYVTRGGATTIVAQNFFTSIIPQDRYNSEALTFTRGPNAILFGLGNSAGAFVSSTKRAKPRNAVVVEQMYDDRGSQRSTLDLNRVLIRDYLAFRYVGLLENLNSFRLHADNNQQRQFFTLRFTPFPQTTLRANYESGHVFAAAVRPWPDYDAVSPWIAAGRPFIDTFVNSAGGKPNGTQNFAYAGLTSTQFSVGGTRVPTLKLQNQGQSAPTTFANGFPVNGASFRSLVNDAIYPTFATAFGNTAYRHTDFNIASVFLEQQVTRDLFLELAFNRYAGYQKALNGFVGQNSYIYVDPNRQLPDGSPNPNVGMLYSQSQATLIDYPNFADNYRAMASYQFDFAKHFRNWFRHLGRHQGAFFGENTEKHDWASNNGLFNATPLVTTGAAANPSNAANAIQFRYYYDPAVGKIGTQAGRGIEAFPVIYANDKLPSRDPSGVTPAFFSQQGPTVSRSIVRTYAFALQSFFWKDRVVVTNGRRQDNVRGWTAFPNDFVGLRDANGTNPRPDGYDPREFRPLSRTERGGRTRSHGVVFHAFRWLSLSYNTSNNFQVNAASRNIYGELLPNPEGVGKDYGARFSLCDDRVFLDLTYYTNSSLNGGDSISNNAAGNFKQFDNIWIAIADFTGDAKYRDKPYSSLATVWQDVVSTTSKGCEFSLTANPTRQWRVTLNGSQRGDNTTTARGVFVNRYMAQYIPLLKAHPEWQNLNTTGNLTVAQRVAELETILINFNAIRNSPAANFAAKWTLNLIQSYDLPREGFLRGFSVGGSMNARGKAINGFAVDSKAVVDPTLPYYSPAYANFGAWVTYRRKLCKERLDWRLQLNVRNVLDRNTIYPLIAVDTRDGKHTPDVAIYTLKEPRTYQFTSTFRF
jgi:iron complex outermembrane receptor protein